MDHRAAYILYGVGFCGLLFSIVRTYYRIWKMKKEREAAGFPSRSINNKSQG